MVCWAFPWPLVVGVFSSGPRWGGRGGLRGKQINPHAIKGLQTCVKNPGPPIPWGLAPAELGLFEGRKIPQAKGSEATGLEQGIWDCFSGPGMGGAKND